MGTGEHGVGQGGASGAGASGAGPDGAAGSVGRRTNDVDYAVTQLVLVEIFQLAMLVDVTGFRGRLEEAVAALPDLGLEPGEVRQLIGIFTALTEACGACLALQGIGSPELTALLASKAAVGKYLAEHGITFDAAQIRITSANRDGWSRGGPRRRNGGVSGAGGAGGSGGAGGAGGAGGSGGAA